MHHRSTHSTDLLSKTYSRVKLAQSNIHHKQSPKSRPFTSRPKKNMDSMLHESLIAKNKKLSIMLRTVHSYMVNIQDMDWIMNQTEKIIKNYMKITLQKLGHGHKIQVQNLYNEITKLIQRFSGIDKKSIFQMTIPLKDNRSFNNSQNVNLMNFKKTQTIGSFKYYQTENQQDGIHPLQTTDFSKIKLPSVIKQNQLQENIQSSRSYHNNTNNIKNDYKLQYETKISQYQATIKILKEDIEKQRSQKDKIKKQLQKNITDFNKKINTCNTQWEAYKIFATNCIRKCKHYLNQISQTCPSGSQRVQDILDEIFTWQNKLDRKIINGNLDQLDILKQQKIKEVYDIESEIKTKRDELNKIHNEKSNFNIGMNSTHKIFNNKYDDSDLVRILLLQASSIENLI